MFNTQILAGSSGQGGETQQSLKFNDDESQYLSWTPAAAGNRKTFTYSTWVKRGKISADNPHWGISAGTLNNSSNPRTEMLFNTSDSIVIGFNTGSWFESTTNAKFRDTSAWYHFVVSVDMTQSTASDRMKFYVNGVLQTFSTYSVPAQNTDLPINNTLLHGIGEYIAGESSASYQFDGYLSDVYFIDGQALDASSFGQFTDGYWEAIDYAGSYGTNGFHLTFEDDVVSEGFNTVTYTGNGGTQSISGLGFEPDFVWIKLRNQAGDYHNLFDSVRGATKRLFSNDTNAENTDVNTLTSFDADGFSIGSNGNVNTSGINVVAWCWDAGSGSAASNTDGSITSTVKANPSYGFSIASWTGNATAGATVGHGLSSTPEMIITKNRNNGSEYWSVYHKDVGNTAALSLNSTGTPFTSSAYWNNTSPTSSVFSIGSNPVINESGSGIIAYCFHSVAGYSSFGSYTGNGSTSGPTVTTGFAPAFVMVKRTDSTGSWFIVDNTRDPRSSPTKDLQPNNTGAETDNSAFYTFTSTGFQLKTTGTAVNASGGTYIYMAFADTREAAFWKDVSGQGNHWTPNNLDYRDSLIDSPANNFAVFNPLDLAPATGTFSEGNLKTTGNGSNSWAMGSISFPTTGKWYAEFAPLSSLVSTFWVGLGGPSGYAYYTYDGTIGNQTGSLSTGNATYTSGDVIGVAVDRDNDTVAYYHNGTLQYTSTSYDTTDFTFKVYLNTSYTCAANFGQDSTFAGNRPAGGNVDDNGIGDFAYAPPSGYLALCTANLPTPSIVDGSEHFNTVLWSGDSVDNRDITGIGFDADLTWFKARSNGNSHGLFDTVRGNSNPNGLSSNSTSAEFDWTGIFKGHITDGFTVGTDSAVNQSGQTYAAWNWKAGGTAVSNTDGTITSQVSAGEYMSICTWTGNGTSGATIGHGLNKVPSMLIVKRRNTANGWPVYHEALGTGSEVYLNYSQGTTSSNFWITSPTSSVFSVSNSDYVNTSSDTYVGYAFANLDGACKVGSYTGNGSSDGPFVYTGFRPAWIMFKGATIASHWTMFDATRHPSNVNDSRLYANLSNAEDNPSAYKVDLLSNGFKLRHTGSDFNTSGQTYIYLAFAENPFKYANAR